MLFKVAGLGKIARKCVKKEELSAMRPCVMSMFHDYNNQKEPGKQSEREVPVRTEDNQEWFPGSQVHEVFLVRKIN